MSTVTLRISFELAFGEGSPYSALFPSLYGLPYSVNRAITQEVMDKVVNAVARLFEVNSIQTAYGPGGYQTYPATPSGQIELSASRAKIRDVINAIGYLAQQTEVIALRPSATGPTQFLDITQQEGQELADPQFVQSFWRELLSESPNMAQGFQPVEVNGSPGIRIVNSGPVWDRATDYPAFHRALERVEERLGIRVEYQEGRAEFLRSGNDWTKEGTGDGYLQRLNTRRRPAIRRRLVNLLQPQTERWIADAFRQHAPEEFRRFRERLDTPRASTDDKTSER